MDQGQPFQGFWLSFQWIEYPFRIFPQSFHISWCPYAGLRRFYLLLHRNFSKETGNRTA
jgi:hypothetical protein